MPPYPQQLLKKLTDHGWDVVNVQESPHWWINEHWWIRSVRQAWGMELVLSFLIDPSWQGNTTPAQAIWAIGVHETLPVDWVQANQGVVSLCMTKRHFETKLNEFIEELDAYRNQASQSIK